MLGLWTLVAAIAGNALRHRSPPGPGRPRLGAILLAAGLATVPVLGQTPDLESEDPTDGAGYWLHRVAPLMSPDEIHVFEELETGADRDEFLHRFWRVRDPEPDRGGNPVREGFIRNLRVATASVGDPGDHRFRTVVLLGPPRYGHEIECPDLRPLHLFHYPPRTGHSEGTSALFYRASESRLYSLWSPGDPLESLVTRPQLLQAPTDPDDEDPTPTTFDERLELLLERLAEVGCLSGREHLAGVLRGALRDAASWNDLTRASPFPDPVEVSGWLDDFLRSRSEVATTSAGDPELLTLSFPAVAGDPTVIHGILRLPANGGPASPGRETISLYGQLHSQPTPETESEPPLPILFQQHYHARTDRADDPDLYLEFVQEAPPGSYRLVLQVEDATGQSLHRERRGIEVPPSGAVVPSIRPGAGLVPEDLSQLAHHPTLRLFPPAGIQVGTIAVLAGTTGTGIDKVRFTLDDGPTTTVESPPWTTTFDLGDRPRPHRLVADGLDSSGRVVARDEIELNAGVHRFEVRLLSPRAGSSVAGGTLLRAQVEPPAGSRVERLEVWIDDDRVVTLFQPPWVHPIRIRGATAIVKVVAILDDGRRSEEIAVVNVPGTLDEVEVQQVELFAGFHRRKKPVEDLTVREVRVLENGQEQRIAGFERVSDLPVHLGLVIDSSESMVDELPLWVEGALHFFETVLTPEDQAAVVTIANRTRLAVPLTRDLTWLADGASDLAAGGGTALWDGLVDTLNYFGGLPGRRALILVSDGDDQHSRIAFEDALAFAERSGSPSTLST